MKEKTKTSVVKEMLWDKREASRVGHTSKWLWMNLRFYWGHNSTEISQTGRSSTNGRNDWKAAQDAFALHNLYHWHYSLVFISSASQESYRTCWKGDGEKRGSAQVSLPLPTSSSQESFLSAKCLTFSQVSKAEGSANRAGGRRLSGKHVGHEMVVSPMYCVII